MRRETEISDRVVAVVAGLCKDTPYLSCPLAPSPSLMERGKRCWRMAPGAACGQIWCNCGAFAPYFFGFFLSLPVDAGVEPAEVVFKGVQIVQLTLTLAGF